LATMLSYRIARHIPPNITPAPNLRDVTPRQTSDVCCACYSLVQAIRRVEFLLQAA